MYRGVAIAMGLVFGAHHVSGDGVPAVSNVGLPVAQVDGVGAGHAQRGADGLVRALLRHQQGHLPDVAHVVHRQHVVGRHLAEEGLQGALATSALVKSALAMSHHVRDRPD